MEVPSGITANALRWRDTKRAECRPVRSSRSGLHHGDSRHAAGVRQHRGNAFDVLPTNQRVVGVDDGTCCAGRQATDLHSDHAVDRGSDRRRPPIQGETTNVRLRTGTDACHIDEDEHLRPALLMGLDHDRQCRDPTPCDQPEHPRSTRGPRGDPVTLHRPGPLPER